MAGIIKNQILKHLQRYVKKLSSDRINVSTLKGEGELTDLELDEEVLTELLALPIWMKIKKAQCNRARLLIQWTKLKSIPIRLILDTIEIQIEACEELRPVVTASTSHLTLPSAGKYGFVNKVVDGITVTVESVEIRFCSTAFESKVQISRILVESKSPQWKKVELPHTRLKDLEKGELLIFKEIEWQTLRLEAQSTKEKHLAPIRLLANQTKARVVIKKKLIDCSVIGCRLSLLLDDLLWVLTDSQILAAAHFMSSLSGLVKQATEMVQAVKAARKLETLHEYRTQQFQAASQNRTTINSESSRIFDAFDVKETSYHLICEKIDLHFCDDAGGGRSSHPDLCDGGAGQVQLTQFFVDFYPYHLAAADRRHWFRYYNNDLNHWLKEALKSFNNQLMDLFPKSSTTGVVKNPMDNETNVASPPPRKFSMPASRLSEQLSKLMSTCLVVKIRDICMYKVTTSSKETPTPFISSYLERPKDVSAVNMEFTWFYNPGGVSSPCPSPKFYTQVNPLQIHLDVCTILWLNSFVSNIQSSIPQSNAQINDDEYLDVRLELIMPKVIFEEKIRYPAYKERPTALQIQASRIIVSNYRSNETGTRAQLATTIEEIEKHGGFSSDNGIPQIPPKLTLHSKGLDKVREDKSGQYYDGAHLTTDVLWTEARDVWCICIDTVWADFCVDPKFKNTETTASTNNVGEAQQQRRKFRSSAMTSQSDSLLLPFVDSVPLSIWFYCEEELIDPEFSMGKRKDIQAILRTDGMCNVQLTNQQYQFLLRAAEAISEISLFLTIDTRKTYIVTRRDDSVHLSGCLPRIEISFILPCLENPDVLQRECTSSLNDIDQPLSDPLQSPTRTQRLQEQVASWNISQDTRSNVEPQSGEALPISPEKFYSDFSTVGVDHAPALSLTSVDSIKSSFSQGMKQGISNIVVSFTKVGGGGGGGPSTPDSEVTSMGSTDSSENNFITLDPDQELPSSFHNDEEPEECVEVAEEVIEDNSQSTGSFSIHNPYGKEDTVEINVLTVALNNLLIRQQSEGLSSSIALLCKTLMVDECGAIPWKEFQTLFATRSKKWRASHELLKNLPTEINNNAITISFTQRIDDITFLNCLTSDEMMNALKQVKTSKCPRVNLIDRPGPESPIRKAITVSTHPHVTANFDLCEGKANEGHFISLHSSILKAAAEFFEDEIPPTVLPMKICVVGASIEILEDKGPNFPPTKIRLQDSIMVTRNDEGVFSVGCPCKKQPKSKVCNGREVISVASGVMEESLLFTKQEIALLKQRVSELEKDKSTLQSQLQNFQRNA